MRRLGRTLLQFRGCALSRCAPSKRSSPLEAVLLQGCLPELFTQPQLQAPIPVAPCRSWLRKFSQGVFWETPE